MVTALSVSGIASDRFIFEGFLPVKAGARQKRLEHFMFESRTVIFYESPHRILDSLRAMRDVFGGQRQVVVARELTKAFETIRGDQLERLCEWVAADPNQQKGEFVLLLEGVTEAPAPSIEDEDKLLALLLMALPIKKASKIVAEFTGANKKALYQRALEMQGRLKRES